MMDSATLTSEISEVTELIVDADDMCCKLDLGGRSEESGDFEALYGRRCFAAKLSDSL